MPVTQRLSAFRLLLSTGILLGFNTPLGKLAHDSGISPASWSFAIAGGGAAILLGFLLLQRQSIGYDRAHLRYYFFTALLSYVVPNLVLYAAIPRLGAGMAAIYFTLSPIITLSLSILLRMRRPGALGGFGILLGCVGALLVIFSKGELNRSTDLTWAFAALLIPLSLAVGNIYRTRDWPADGAPLVLAMGSNAAASVFLMIAAVILDGALPFAQLAIAPELVLVQVIIAAMMFALFFRLQVAGGPVYLSQIGYVAAATALVIGVLFLGEHYGLTTWGGAGVIVLGVLATTIDRGAKANR